MGKYNIHKDLKRLENMNIRIPPALLPALNALSGLGLKTVKLPAGLGLSRRMVEGFKGGRIGLSIYEPDGIGAHAPCLVYFHGGGFMLQAAPHHLGLVYAYALKTPCKVVFVDYRLAASHPFPVGVEDCYAAYLWTCGQADSLGIDANRIAVGGDSAGGALAAAVAHMARDRKAKMPCFQMLVYPVTDARQNTESMRKYTDTPLWNSVQNEAMWRMYLRNGDIGMRGYASPMEAVSFSDLPDAYVEVAEFDCLHDEGIRYAEILRESGCRVELYKSSGTIHGFELAEKSEPVAISVAKRVEALKQAFRVVPVSQE